MRIGVIGAGASGLMASYIAAKSGHQVTLFEHTDKIGKKILATGGGKCNLSNEDMNLSHFHGDESFIKEIMNKVGRKEVFDIFEDMGLLIGNRNGYFYPYNEQASTVARLLELSCRSNNVEILLGCNITDIIDSKAYIGSGKALLTVKSNLGDYSFDKVIICAGSMASAKTGSDGSGYELAKKLGHTVIKPLPALCALKCEGNYFKKLSGIRCKADIDLHDNGIIVGKDSGEIQLTAYGISGIPVMQLSYLASIALNEGRSVAAGINFLKGMNADFAMQYVRKKIKSNPNESIANLMLGSLNEKLIPVILDISGIRSDKKASALKEDEISGLAKNMTNFKVNIYATNSFEEAQVCCGGIDTKEVCNTLESKLVKGVFFAGEILNVNGDCGGYNLQWAFSTGALAGGYHNA